jgi:hypothetical protein
VLGARFKSSKYSSIPPGCDPHLRNTAGGKSRNAGNLAAALILNQNPFFEIGSNSLCEIETGQVGQPSSFMQSFFIQGGWEAWDPTILFAILFLGASVPLGAFELYNWARGRIQATPASVYINLVPVTAVMIGWGVLGEALTPARCLAAGPPGKHFDQPQTLESRTLPMLSE